MSDVEDSRNHQLQSDNRPLSDHLSEQGSATMTRLVTEAATALADVYEPAGVLMFWSSRITYLDGKRPCDIYRDGDVELMERLVRRVNALADGAFA